MDRFLDKTGTNYFWQKIKYTFVAKEQGKGLSSNDFTDAEKEKLSGLSGGDMNSNTVFHTDGSITETYADGSVTTTTFGTGLVQETTVKDGKTKTKKTIFNADGSISVEYS